jgi:hypothetical protein
MNVRVAIPASPCFLLRPCPRTSEILIQGGVDGQAQAIRLFFALR